jgi:hypothetical protein
MVSDVASEAAILLTGAALVLPSVVPTPFFLALVARRSLRAFCPMGMDDGRDKCNRSHSNFGGYFA